MTAGPYSRIYHSIVDDPMFERVYRNPHALGTWLQMLLTADAMYPNSAPMTSRNPTVRLLIDCGLVIEKPGNRYSVRGLEAERERRSAIGRNAVAVRWNNERNADLMPRRDETRIEKTSIGANASKPTNGEGESEPGLFMRSSPGPKIVAAGRDIRRQEDEAWSKCADCGELGRRHSANVDHPFRLEQNGASAWSP